MATNLSAQISALATQVGSDVKTILANIGSLDDLTTDQKASLVVAINSLKAAIAQVEKISARRSTTAKPARRPRGRARKSTPPLPRLSTP